LAAGTVPLALRREDLASIEYLREHLLGGVRIVSDRLPKA
jgi:hypothetical protein